MPSGGRGHDGARSCPATTVDAGAGEADVGLAIRDALATFPADVIVVAVDATTTSSLEDAIASRVGPPAGARRIEGVPVRFVTGRPTDDVPPNRETRAAENEDLFRRLNERLHVLATRRERLRRSSPRRRPSASSASASQASCSRVIELTPERVPVGARDEPPLPRLPGRVAHEPRASRPSSSGTRATGSSRSSVRPAKRPRSLAEGNSDPL